MGDWWALPLGHFNTGPAVAPGARKGRDAGEGTTTAGRRGESVPCGGTDAARLGAGRRILGPRVDCSRRLEDIAFVRAAAEGDASAVEALLPSVANIDVP